MFTATTDTGSVTWDNGALTGDADLVRIVEATIPGSAMFNYWGERETGLTPEFTAYITVGCALQTACGGVTISPVPDNPDGYEPEGVWPDESGGSLLAAAYGRHLEEFYNKNHDPKDGRFATGPGGLPKGNTETWAKEKSRLLGIDDLRLEETHSPVNALADDAAQQLSEWEARTMIHRVAGAFRDAIPEDAEVRIRVPFSVIERVAADGMKSQHETSSSQGVFAPDVREAVEQHMFSAAGTKPIYGYIPTAAEHSENRVYHYGQLALVLTPEAAARTTVTRGDSLTVSALNFNERQLEDVPAPIKLSEIHTATDARLFLASPEDNTRHNDGLVNYFETQTHGGVRPQDIARIIMPNKVGKGVAGEDLWQGYSVERLQKLFPNAIIEVAQPYTVY